MICVLCGGVGAARFLAGLVQVVAPGDVTAVVNVGDDTELYGLHVSPDLDTVTYTLAGEIDTERGWGLRGETWQAMATLRGLGDDAWFNLGDRDLGTHLYRTRRLAEGAPLSTVTAELAAGWGVGVRVLPVTDDQLRTRVTINAADAGGAVAGAAVAAAGAEDTVAGAEDTVAAAEDTVAGAEDTVAAAGDTVAGAEDTPAGRRVGSADEGAPRNGKPREVAFQEYFVRLQHAVPVRAVRFDGAEACTAGPGVLEAIAGAEAVVIAPSNPLVSIAPVLAVPGVRDAVVRRRAETVAVSPIVAGAALKGPADRMLTELGHEASAVGVARLYAPLAASLVIDEADAALADAVTNAGTRALVAPTVMANPELAAGLARAVLDAAGVPS